SAGREACRHRGCLPSLALSPRHNGGARDRLQTRHRRDRRGELPEENVGRRAVSGDMDGADGAVMRDQSPAGAAHVPEIRSAARIPLAALTAAVSVGVAMFFSLYSLIPVTRADSP